MTGLISDILLILGCLSIVTGIVFIYWPASLIVAGLMLWVGAYLKAREAVPKGDKR